MIKSFQHKGIQRFFETGSKAGIQPKHASKLTDQLTLLDGIKRPELMNVPGWEWHPLKGDMEGFLGGERQWELAVGLWIRR